MNHVNKIYLDMDGVLADFDRGVRKLCHLEPLNQMNSTSSQNDALWSAVRSVPHFYDRLEPVPGAIRMVQLLWQWYGDKVEILTGIPKPKRNIENAAEDKINWVHRFLPENIKVNIVYREEKPQYCHGKTDILIDDYEKNVNEWMKCGGTGILFSSAIDIQKKMWCLKVREKYHLENRGIWRGESGWSDLISGFRYNILSTEWDGAMYDVINTAFADDYLYPAECFELVDDVPGENGDWDLVKEIFELSVVNGSAEKMDLRMMLDTLSAEQRNFLCEQCGVSADEMLKMDYQTLYDKVFMVICDKEMAAIPSEDSEPEENCCRFATLAFGLVIVLENMDRQKE